MSKRPIVGIATDAAHSTKREITEFQGIDLATGERIFYQNLGKRTASKKKNKALQKAEIFLKMFAVDLEDIEVLHWDNKGWGETPADFGNK